MFAIHTYRIASCNDSVKKGQPGGSDRGWTVWSGSNQVWRLYLKLVTISTNSSPDTSLLRDTLTRSMSLRKEATLEACGITPLQH